jgi:hypothetical protein
MCFSGFLAELHQLVSFLESQRIQIHTVDGLVKVGCGSAQVAPCSITLSQCIIAGECIIGVVQEHLELADGFIPPMLLLIEPAQEVAGIRSIKPAFQDLFAEVDSIIKPPLGLKGLCLS